MGKTQTDESTVQNPESTPDTQASSQKEEPSSQKEETTPTTYTQEQVDRMLHLERTKAGRDWKALETELESVKTQLSQRDSTEANLKDEISDLNQQIDQLSSDDPAKLDLIKERKAARDKLRELRGKETELETREKSLASRLEKAEAKERDDLILEIAEEYQDCDTDKLTKLCLKYDVKNEADIRELADTFWSKKGTQQQVYVDSGQSGIPIKNLKDMTPEQKVAYGLNQKIKKQ